MIKPPFFKILAAIVAIPVISVLVVGCSSGSSTSAPAAPITTFPPTSLVVNTLTAAPPPASPTPLLPVSVPPTATLTPPASPFSPSPSALPTPTPFPTVVYKPEAAPYIPSGAELELFKYVLQLINTDRAAQNLPPVELTFNAAAQKHAQDMLANNYLAHWGTDGLKPYMRYTLEGGFNYEQENCALTTGNRQIDAKTEIRALEHDMVFDDAASNWGHRDNILNKLHKKVNIGLAYNNNNLALVQQFEGDYVEFYQPPTLKGKILTLSGHFKLAGLTLNNAAITYDAAPKPLTGAELTAGPYHSYGLGPSLGQIFPPPPPNAQYNNLPAGSIIAAKGSVEDAVFWLEADISPILAKGPGVYTLCLIALLNSQPNSFTNYSIWVQ